MEIYRFGNMEVIPERGGLAEFTKLSCPIRYGRFAEIRTPDYIFQFNLNGEIKFIQGRGPTWPHPGEWLKRTVADDWLYYSAGSYNGIFDLIGEYYYPCLPYASNSLFKSYAIDPAVREDAVGAWDKLQSASHELAASGRPQAIRRCLAGIADNDRLTLRSRARRLHRLIGGSITVLPPDTRHVDYETVPVVIADGCLYHCGFCRIQSAMPFKPRSCRSILEQLRGLKKFYGRDISNYNSVFLGLHDALLAEAALIEFAAQEAYRIFEFERSNLRHPRLFLFGSADALLASEEAKFEMLNRLPFKTHINIGLESADRQTLAFLKKPVTVAKVNAAFARAIQINRTYADIEASVNFVLGDRLPAGHLSALLELVRNSLDRFYSKGAVYLSPLIGSRAAGETLKQFYEVKTASRLPVYLYLIQRL